MPYCPNCRDEFQDWVKVCPDCGAAMVDVLPAEPKPEPKPEPDLEPPLIPLKNPVDIVTVATFSYPTEAHLAVAKLESEGIPAYVADEHVLTANWMYNIAVGGVKVWVREPDLEAARRVLDYREPVDQSMVEADETCPACGSADIHYETFSARPLFITWLISAIVIGGGFILPFMKRKWVCRDCGHRWKETAR